MKQVKLFFKHCLILLFLCSCGQFEENNAYEIFEKDKTINVPVKVFKPNNSFYTNEKNISLTNNEESLPYLIEIRNCSNFEDNEIKLIETTLEEPSSIIKLVNQGTNCSADLIKFYQNNNWYMKSKEQISQDDEKIKFESIDTSEENKKVLYIENKSKLDVIQDDYSEISFEVSSSPNRSAKRSMTRSVEICDDLIDNDSDGDIDSDDSDCVSINSFFTDLDLPFFSIITSSLSYSSQNIHLEVTFNCLSLPTANACNSNTTDNVHFYLFKRDLSKISYTSAELLEKISSQTYLGGTYQGDDTLIDSVSPYNWKSTFTIPSNYLTHGSNGAVIVVGTDDPYAPLDIYSRSYRYHIINLEYGSVGIFH